jgi:hypothetical protein
MPLVHCSWKLISSRLRDNCSSEYVLIEGVEHGKEEKSRKEEKS